MSGDDTFALVLGIMFVVSLVFAVLTLVGAWKMFVKSGQPGWAALIPIYNLYVVTQIAGRPWWWIVLIIIPIVGIVFAIMLTSDISKCFGRGIGTTLGLLFLPTIFIPILGFGSAQYQGPSRS